MSRRTILLALTGVIVATGFGAPALAESPVSDDRESVCLRLDPPGGREGVCVWIGLPDRP